MPALSQIKVEVRVRNTAIERLKEALANTRLEMKKVEKQGKPLVQVFKEEEKRKVEARAIKKDPEIQALADLLIEGETLNGASFSECLVCHQGEACSCCGRAAGWKLILMVMY